MHVRDELTLGWAAVYLVDGLLHLLRHHIVLLLLLLLLLHVHPGLLLLKLLLLGRRLVVHVPEGRRAGHTADRQSTGRTTERHTKQLARRRFSVSWQEQGISLNLNQLA